MKLYDKKPHVLQIMVMNTSTMDFSAPLFWKLRGKYPDIRISILYCYKDKRQILRYGKFFSEYYNKLGIREYDFSDFITFPITLIKPLLKLCFSTSPLDKKSEPDNRKNIKYKNIRSSENRLQKNSLINLLNYINSKLKQIKRNIIVYIYNINNVLEILDPDIILLDNKSYTNFHGREFFFQYFNRQSLPIMLLPHGAYYRTYDAFCPFDEKGENLPQYCEDWIPFKFMKPWVSNPEKRKQFHYIGYPGLDSDWCEYLMKQSNSIRNDASERLKCLFVLRDFLPKGFVRNKNIDPYCMDYDEILSILELISSAFQRIDQKIELIIKPHPNNNYHSVEKLFSASKIPNWIISHEANYKLLPNINFIISLFSTAFLPAISCGIPTIIMKTNVQDFAFKEWNEIENLYKGFQYSLDDNSKFEEIFSQVLKDLYTEKKSVDSIIDSDLIHLREFYPDGACDRAMSRLEFHLDNINNADYKIPSNANKL